MATRRTSPEYSAGASIPTDIVIAGAGIAGTLAATALARAGYTVFVIDRNETHPAEFKAEHLDGPQIGQLIRLGFLDDLTRGLYRGETVTLARHGRIAGTGRTVNFGLGYDELVNRARCSLNGQAAFVAGRIAEIETSGDRQYVRLADGRVLTSRLLILATGSGRTLPRQAGIGRRMIRERHSVTFGVDIAPADTTPFGHPFVVYHREKVADKIDYLAAFTLRDTTRVNLFTYRDYRDEWTSAFLADPAAKLHDALPGLARVIGPYRVTSPAVARPVDLYTSEHHERDGVVLIGDAFQTTCPATGMGIVKVLTDIEQLVTVHVPGWFATPGMEAAKLASYYNDPVKRACDAKAIHDSQYRRSLSTETTTGWHLHRLRVQTQERLRIWRARSALAAHPRIAEQPAAAVV